MRNDNFSIHVNVSKKSFISLDKFSSDEGIRKLHVSNIALEGKKLHLYLRLFYA
jgi:hypothetical protein